MTDGPLYKACSRCTEIKPLTDFYARKGEKRHSACKPCYVQRLKEKPCPSRTSKTYRRTLQLKSYGLTAETFSALLIEQDHKCAICKQDISEKVDIDHDHKTKKVRGLLCGFCNRGLGHFYDDIEKIASAIRYLMAPPAQRVAGI